jgi:hypothetical protein
MIRRPETVRSAIPWVITLALLASRLAAVPALSDPVAGSVPASIHLSVPTLYLLLAPLFTLWDGISMLSMRRLQGFLIGLALLYLLWRILRHVLIRAVRHGWRIWGRELAVLVVSLVALLLFLIAGALWHRPMLALAGVPTNQSVVDFHSHTTFSHDVGSTWMRSYDLEANRRWHARAGFDAVFVTDHNGISRESRAATRAPQQVSGLPALCPGIEISGWRAHIVLLGDTLPIERAPYNASLEGLLALLQTSESAFGSLTLASLPEYWKNHWVRLDTLIAAGLDGFEIVNASPKANDFSVADRDRVIALARRHNLFVAGVSDSHGWGATSMVWNLVQTRESDRCASILQELRRGFPSVQVIERHRLRPDDRWPNWLTPLGMLWETWRSMGWPLTLAWLAWIWLLWYVPTLLRSNTSRVNIAGSDPDS